MKPSHHLTDRVDRTYVIRYTLLFLGMASLVFLPFIINRRSLVNKVDGFSQYIVYLRYMGQYLRSALRQFLHGSFRLPSYDFSIGMGDDIGQIVRFHPLDFLSVFVPASCTEYLYDAILIVRFYAAGLAFSFYAFSWNTLTGPDPDRDRVCAVNVLSGAMIYVFCGFMLIRVMNHPIYAAPFIVFPLLLLGAEKVMHRKGYLLFVFSVFLGFWSNYYFMYIMSVGLLVYMLVRFGVVYRSDRVRAFFLLLGKMLLSYLLGLAMSMITLYPMIRRYLSSARLPGSAEAVDLLVYEDKRRYIAWLLNLISPYQSSGNGMNLNFAVIVLPCLVLLFSFSWKRLRSLKLLTISCLLILLIPGAGYVLAFFNRENSRWMFLLALCLAMAVVFTLDCFAQISRKQILAVAAAAGVFWGMVLVQTLVTGMNIYNIAAAAELTVCLAILLAPAVRKGGRQRVRRCALAITCVSTVLNGFMTFSSGFGNLTKEYVLAGKITEKYGKVPRSMGTAMIQDDSFWRVEGYNVEHWSQNSAIFSGYNGTSEYNSILNADMIDAMMSQVNRGLDAVTTMSGLDARPVALNLAHVKYFTVKPRYSSCVPYGFSAEPVYSQKKVSVYECEHPLSFGYSSRAFITRENYNALSPLERELVQLDAIVADSAPDSKEDPADALREAGLAEITKADTPVEAERLHLPAQGEGFTCEGGIVHTEKHRTMKVFWKERAGTDAWLWLPNLSGPGEKTYIKLKTKKYKTKITIRSEEQLYYTGSGERLIHLGYSTRNALTTAKIKFGRRGDYDLSGAGILYVPMENYTKKIEALNAYPLENETIRDGRITGTVRFDEPGILALSVPQADGWTVKVDAEKVSPVRGGSAGPGTLTANVMYQGILIPAGEHTVELTYETPGSAAGYAAAIPAMLLFLVLFVLDRRKRRKEKVRGQETCQIQG